MVPHILYFDGPSDYFPAPDIWGSERSPNAPSVQTSGLTQPPVLAPDETDPLSGTFAGTAAIGEGEGKLARETLEANGYYINIHTVDNPDGELRGQITPVPTDGEPTPTPTSR